MAERFQVHKIVFFVIIFCVKSNIFQSLNIQAFSVGTGTLNDIQLFTV